MTLQQLKYVIEVAEKGSITEAAKSLFIAQPSLSAAIRELEEEIATTIFVRKSRGILLTPEGAEFLGYARQVVQQAALIEEKYIARQAVRQRFSVSTQHYSFTSSAFIELVRAHSDQAYEFILREGKTYDTIMDVRNLRSEMGVIYMSAFNEAVISKTLREANLAFSELFAARPHIFVGRNNRGNDELTFQLARKDDIWCHASKVHGSHVIISCGGNMPPDDTVTQAAQLAAYYAESVGGQNIAVDVTAVKQVKKIPSGKPGMVIYHTYKTVIVNPYPEIVVDPLNAEKK